MSVSASTVQQVERAKARSSAAQTGWTKVSLDEGCLMAAAEQQAGLSDWGNDLTFRVGLGQLLAAVENMSAAVKLRPIVAAHVIRLLVTRLHLVDDGRRHSEILAGKIERPLIVTGM